MFSEESKNIINVENDELVSLTGDEIRIMMALCGTVVKFKMNVILGVFKSDNFNCIFKTSDNEWRISFFDNDKVEVFNDVILACYKLIKGSVAPQILDYVINYFDKMLNQEGLDSDFLEFANVKKKQRVKL